MSVKAEEVRFTSMSRFHSPALHDIKNLFYHSQAKDCFDFDEVGIPNYEYSHFE